MIPEAEPGGRPRKAPTRTLVNAILYFLRAGMAWRLLPHDLPPWQTVYYYLRRWQREGVWDRVHHALVMADRERAGREASPSAAIHVRSKPGSRRFVDSIQLQNSRASAVRSVSWTIPAVTGKRHNGTPV